MALHKNLSMLTDFYEFTMANGYLESGIADREACFDMFYREIPDEGGYAIMAGVEQLVDYMNNLSFSQADIDYMASKKCFSPAFLDYLKNFRFACDVWCVPEGAPIFPYEPIVTVKGPVMQAQFLETMILLVINHQSLIATKANRIVRAAGGRPIMEFGSRRAQGTDAAILGARAAFIGGAAGTACAISDREFGVPALGTMAHSWVQMFPSEFDAFAAYAKVYPGACTLLIDTYNVMKSGLPNAIRCAKEVLEPMGFRLAGVRIDSGDAAYLSKKVRAVLDASDLKDCKIVLSNSLDEYLILDLLNQGACVDSFGVGERLITSKSSPVFGGVYKLAAVENGQGQMEPRIKISENIAKITTPGVKKVWRITQKSDGKYLADLVALADEVIDTSKPLTIFDPAHTWKKMTVENYEVQELLQPIFLKGKCVYKPRDIREIQKYCKDEMDKLWPEVKRFRNPHAYYVDLSQKLWDLKHDMLEAGGK